MIHHLRIQNFRGQSADYDLREMTVITGPNGSGKSTISKAIEVALFGFVHGDNVAKTADAVFSAYCGESKAEMSVTITTGAGELTRRFRNLRGKVTTTIEWNGKKVGAREDIPALAGVTIFDTREFWGLTASQRLERLCKHAGVDPDALADLNERIEVANSQKRIRAEDLRAARQALEDHERQLQSVAQRDGEDIDLANIETRLADLRKEESKITADLSKAHQNNERLASRTARAEAITAELCALNESRIERPRGADMCETKDLEKRVKALRDAVSAHERAESLRARMAAIDTRTPTPPAFGPEHIRKIDEALASIRSGSGAASALDHEIVSWARGLSEKIKAIPDGDEPTVKSVRVAIKEHIGPYLARVQAAESQEQAQAEVQRLKADRARIATLITSYDESVNSHRRATAQKDALLQQVAEAEAVEMLCESDDPAREIEEAEAELAARRLSADQYRQWKAAEASREQRIASLTEELSKMGDAPMDHIDISALERALAAVRVEVAEGTDHVSGLAELRYQKQVVTDKASQVERLGSEVRALTGREESLISERAALVDAVREQLEERVNTIVAPIRCSIEIAGAGRSLSVAFVLEHPGGRRCTREAASQAEQVEFDAALASALLGAQSGGVIVSELSEISPDRLVRFLGKVASHRGDHQFIGIGHTVPVDASEYAQVIDLRDNLRRVVA